MTKQKTETLHSYRCACGKLLFRGFLLDSTIQIKCRKCGELMSFQGRNDHIKLDDHYALTLSSEGDIVSASSNIQQLFGYKLPELLSKGYGELLPTIADKTAQVDFSYIWSLRDKEEYFFKSKVTYRRKDGELIPGMAQSKFVTTADNTYLFSIFRPADAASEQPYIEPEFSPLREYPFYLQVSIDGTCLDASSSTKFPHVRPKNEVANKPYISFMEEDEHTYNSFHKKLLLKKPFELMNKKYRRSDGTIIQMDAFFVPNFTKDRECIDYSVYVYDHDLLRNHSETSFALNPTV